MTLDTVFDLASLTKVVATAPSVMALVEDGKLRLQDRVAKHIPEFATGGGARDQVTVEQLLTHRAGLAADDPMALYTGTPKEIFERKYRQPLVSAPGSRFLYSDVGFEVLGELVRRVSSLPLEEFARQRVFVPLGMNETGVSTRQAKGSAASSPALRRREKIDGKVRRGEVHDPHAFALGGVAGHAGLFSTADDLARFCGAMLAGGGGALSPATVAAMTRAALLRRREPPRPRMGRGDEVLVRPGRPLPARLVRPHGLDGHVDVAGSRDGHVRRSS